MGSMRIDKIIDYLTKKIFSPLLIEDIVRWDISRKLKFFAFFISLKKKILLQKRWAFHGLHNEENETSYIIAENDFDQTTKKDGITALWRFKNSEDFLEICIQSILPFVDEVIMLVDQNSTDNTDAICKKLAAEFSEKCKYYAYTAEVYPWNHPKYNSTSDNSIHSLSYFYNFCMSKSSYKYVMKFDDDMLCVGEDFGNVCAMIKEQWLEHFLDIPQINISRDDDWQLLIANKYLSSWIAWIFGDHGIFPLSKKTYFFNDTWCENLIAPYWIQYAKTIWFLHLKNLKSGWWMKNYNGYGIEYIKKLNEWSTYIPLPDKYKRILSKRGI